MTDTTHTHRQTAQHHKSVRRAGTVALIAVILLILGGGLRYLSHRQDATALKDKTAQQSAPRVLVVHPTPAGAARNLELPGTLQGFIESPIFARSNGYLLKWTKDIGAHVKQGEQLAEIDTPEIDQQLSQAIASKRQIQANLYLAKSTLERWEQMRLKDVVSQQELDEKRAQLSQTQASLAATEADVARLQNLVSFKHITAPFSGIITKRNVDVGDLITPGNGDNSKALFMLAQTDPLRVYVYVPQTYANRIKVGQQVDVAQQEIPGTVFHGKIERTAGAIDTSTRTLQIEVLLKNTDNTLLPGAYVKVAVPTGKSTALIIPSNTLLFRSEGLSVAKVDASGKVHLQSVSIAQDLGNTLEVSDGVGINDQLILNPPDAITEGDHVAATEKAPDQQSPAPSREKSGK